MEMRKGKEGRNGSGGQRETAAVNERRTGKRADESSEEPQHIYYADASTTDTNHIVLSRRSKPCEDPTLGSISAVTHSPSRAHTDLARHTGMNEVCVCVVFVVGL